MNINWVIIYSLDSFVSTLIDISKIFMHYYTHVFYTSFLESQHYIRLSMLRWYESIGLPHDSVHTFHCSQFQRIPCHILYVWWNAYISLMIEMYSICWNKSNLRDPEQLVSSQELSAHGRNIKHIYLTILIQIKLAWTYFHGN